MKNRYKAMAVFAGATAAFAAFNKIVTHIADEKTANHSGARLKYNDLYFTWRYGKEKYIKCGGGEPLLLIHDAKTGHSLDDWEHIIELFKKHYTVYAVDLPGFGRSSKPALTYSAYLYATFINNFIKQCVGEKTYVVADGGSAAFAAAGCVLKPALYKKMVLVWDKNERNRRMPLIKQRLRKWLARVIEIPVYGAFITNILTLIKTAGGLCNAQYIGDRYVLIAALKNYLWVDINQLIKKIKIPVRMVKPESVAGKPRQLYKFCREF